MVESITRRPDTGEDPKELRGRINLALSLISHRGSGSELEQLVCEALEGATILDLLDVAHSQGGVEEHFRNR